MYAGVFLTTPVILYQVWGFVSPGLYEKERKLAAPFIIFGTIAFLAGASFCYFAVLPQMFEFLLREETAVALERGSTPGSCERKTRCGTCGWATSRAPGRWRKRRRRSSRRRETARRSRRRPVRNCGGEEDSVDVVTHLEGLGKLIDARARDWETGAAAALAGDGEAAGSGRRV